MSVQEDLNQQLRDASPLIAKRIRECPTEEEAAELLYNTLSGIFKTAAEGWRALLDARYPSGQDQ